MSRRLVIAFLFLLTLIMATLSTGNSLFLSIAILIILLLLTGAVSVYWVSHTLQINVNLSDSLVQRGEDGTMVISVIHHGWIPVAPIRLRLDTVSGIPTHEIRLKDFPGRKQSLAVPFHASHVGVSEPGIRTAVIEDLWGLFSKAVELNDSLGELLVFPATFDITPLRFAPGDPGSDAMSRATQDLSSPSDIRPYQPGDPIKKIHWKLSVRKNELLVRKYDESILQDALILLDCSRPPLWGHTEAEADIRDALLETSASVYSSLCGSEHGFRFPLFGNHPVDIDRYTSRNIAFENLCRVDFSASDRFEQILQIESSHLRSIGSVVIISARLNSNMVDMMINMHRIGPVIRFYLVTYVPDDEQLLPLIGKLRQGAIEVSYVTPVSA